MKRREFIAALGAAAWPLAANAQRTATIGILFYTQSPTMVARYRLPAFRNGLAEMGYVEGQNLGIEYLYAEGNQDRLPILAADLVRRQVAVIVTPGSVLATNAAKIATRSIPIVFVTGSDPVKAGLVASYSRPNGNVTGVAQLLTHVGGRRLAMLHELVPSALQVALLTNSANPALSVETRELQQTADLMGLPLRVVGVRDLKGVEVAFAAFADRSVDSLIVSSDPLFLSLDEQLAQLTVAHRLSTMFAYREQVEAGGLISYGTHSSNDWRQAGVYVGKILSGSKPADLPVIQPTKFELVINLKTAKALGLTIPETLLATADEVIQ